LEEEDGFTVGVPPHVLLELCENSRHDRFL
jgi:hypothetical protein